ncbi:hypothetical protein C8R45DRAFT_936077 [Mycena sanguinolenta]|nr:hypothetical protein C8R45DRAFT_936077 [Mycena sanguinolenta]
MLRIFQATARSNLDPSIYLARKSPIFQCESLPGFARLQKRGSAGSVCPAAGISDVLERRNVSQSSLTGGACNLLLAIFYSFCLLLRRHPSLTLDHPRCRRRYRLAIWRGLSAFSLNQQCKGLRWIALGEVREQIFVFGGPLDVIFTGDAPAALLEGSWVGRRVAFRWEDFPVHSAGGGWGMVHTRVLWWERKDRSASAVSKEETQPGHAMDHSSFTFTCPLPTNGGNQRLDAPPPNTSFTRFRVRPADATGMRAEAQSRYRAANQDVERHRARQRMRGLRTQEKEKLERQANSERLRTSDLFQRYKVHVRRHFLPFCGHRSDPEFMRGWERFRFKNGPPLLCDREDACFVLKYSGPLTRESTPTSEEIETCLAKLNGCTLGLAFDWDDETAIKAFERIETRGFTGLEDGDLEFMFRHTCPAPTMENMGCCDCVDPAETS